MITKSVAIVAEMIGVPSHKLEQANCVDILLARVCMCKRMFNGSGLSY